MAEVESVGDILAGRESAPVEIKAEPKAEPKVEPIAEVVEPEGGVERTQPRGEDGKFTKQEAKDEKRTPAHVAAIIDERKKRQALEQRLAELQPPQKKTDFYEDPDKAFQERIDAALRPEREKYYKQSLKWAQRAHTDFEAAAEAFADATERDPRLIEQLRSHDDPGEFIYAIGTQIKELSDVDGDIGKYREKILAGQSKTLAEKDAQIASLTAQLAAATTAKSQLDSIPSSLNSSGSAAKSPSVTSADDDDIRSIVRFNNRR